MSLIEENVNKSILEEFDELYLEHINDTRFNIKDELVKGMVDGMSIISMYEYIANTSASYISKEPNFNKLAVIYELKKLYFLLQIDNLKNLYEKQYEFNLISEKYYEFINNNYNSLINIIDHERDKLIDFFGIKTLQRSYLLKDKKELPLESPQMMFLRCAIQIHFLDDISYFTKFNLIKETYDNMSQLYFTHATPTLFNSGGRFPQLSSCYLLQCPDDLAAISKSIGDMMMISKWAGGIGVNLSDIRANGSIIKSNGGKSTGIIPLCKVLESVARYVNQSSKRQGSIACYIEPWHYDIYDFIDLRKNTGDENLRARDLFIGLWVPNAFMRAVEKDEDWYLMSPDVSVGLTDVHSEEFDKLYYKYVEEGNYIKKIKAIDLYKKILESQLETGMPYMLYKDHANSKSNQKNLGTIKNSNLCVAPETKILTDKGYIEISTLKNKKVNVWNGEKYSNVTVMQTGINQKLIRISFSNNKYLDCTPYHKFHILKKEFPSDIIIIEASKLKIGMKIIKFNLPNLETQENITIKNIEDLGRKDDTYCFNEPEKHLGIFNGIMTGNCSEIIEYSSADEIAVCNLASICLPKFVEEDKGKKRFNFEKLGEIVKIAVNNLNKIINVNFYPVIETQVSNFRHRPIGLGVQGLACCYAKMGFPFDSEAAIKLNKMIFECIYYNALLKSNELAKELGPYDTFKGSPFSEGKLQFHLAGLSENDMSKELNYNWNKLVSDIKEFGTRNSLLTTIMPTASTAQIMNNNESIEPFASNIYVRKTIAGDFIIVNKYLIEDLKKIDKWTDEIYQELVFDNGSVQKLDIPNELKEKYKTAYEMKQSILLKQSVDRGIFIDQSQSLNIFMAKPDFNKLHSCHMYSWKNGLKTGMYYLRSQPVSEGIKFGIDSEIIKVIKNKRNIDQFKNEEIINKKSINYNNEVCETCSA